MMEMTDKETMSH